MASCDHRRRCGAMSNGGDSGGSNTQKEMSLVFAEAQFEHISDVVRINRVVQEHHAGLSPDAFHSGRIPSDLQALWSDRLDDQNSEVVNAMLDSRSVGYIWFEIQPREQDALHMRRDRIYVHHLAVDGRGCGAGVGSRLLERAELAAEEAGISNVVLDAWDSNSPVQKFAAARRYSSINIVLGELLTNQGQPAAAFA